MNQQLTSMKPSITANEGELTVVVRRIRMRNLLLGLLAAAAGVSIPPIVRWVTKAPSTGKTELSNLSIYEMFWVILAVGAASIAVAAALAAREAIRITSDSVTVSESVFIWTVRKATYPLPEIKSIRFGRGRVVLEVRAQNTGSAVMDYPLNLYSREIHEVENLAAGLIPAVIEKGVSLRACRR